MTKAAYFRIEHSSFNRDDWKDTRIGDAAHYGHNLKKRGSVATVGLPIFSSSHEAKTEFEKLVALNTRKNARLGDTLIVSFPVEVSVEHRQLMMERLLWKITIEGRTYAQAWEHTDKPGNPHFHVVLIDRDRVTGKGVGKFGHARSYRKKLGLEPNVTEWMRMQWEQTGNEFFQEHGYSLHFDRRSNLERLLEPAGQHRGFENDNQLSAGIGQLEEVPRQTAVAVESGPATDHNERVIDMVSEDLHTLEPTPEPDTVAYPLEDAHEGEAPMSDVTDEEVGTIERQQDGSVSLAAVEVRQLSTLVAELNRLKDARERIREAEARYAARIRDGENAVIEKGAHQLSSQRRIEAAYNAQKELEGYTREGGELRGFAIKLFGRELKSPTRRRAEAAHSKAESLGMDAWRLERERESHTERVERLAAEAASIEREVANLRTHLRDAYGSEPELERAERTLEAGITKLLEMHASHAANAFEDLEITPDEYRTFLEQKGDAERMAQLDEWKQKPEYERDL